MEAQESKLTKDWAAEDKARAIADIADDMKARDIILIDVRKQCNYTDVFMVATCESSPQLRAVGEKIRREMRAKGFRPLGDEGRGSGRWVALDYGDVLVHLMHPETRVYYRLEQLWADGEPVEWTPSGEGE